MSDILFLEDDKLLAQSLIEELIEFSYSVDWVQESDDAIVASYVKKYHLYLFDVNVPGINGFELLRQLRRSGDATPALFLTSRNQIEDLACGFECGANDYIKKPFDLNELLIRIKSKMPKEQMNLSKNFFINNTSLTINCNNNETLLPLKEFKLLSYLCAKANTFISTDDLIDELSQDNEIGIATLRTYIKNLKRHIQGCGIIENMKGVGYRFKVL